MAFFEKPACAAIDSTGFEERHASKHYQTRIGKTRCRQSYWSKLAVCSDTSSHLILAARVARGPGNDCILWKPLVKDASRYAHIDTGLGDAGFDSEENHAYARLKIGVRLTVIKLNPRTHGRKWPQTKYRRQMKRRFLKRKYGQRSQIESTFSQHKRVLLSSLTARSKSTRKAEMHFRVLVHNLMILWLTAKDCNRAPLRERADEPAVPARGVRGDR